MRATGYVYTRRTDVLSADFVANWLERPPFVEKLPDARWLDSSLGRLLRRMEDDYFLLIHELEDLGRNLIESCELIGEMMDRGVILHVFSEKGLLWGEDKSRVPILTNPPRLAFGDVFSKLARIERERHSSVVKNGLLKLKESGRRLGRPPGTRRGNATLDNNRDEIREQLKNGVTQAYLAREYGVSPSTVCAWVKDNQKGES